MGMRLCLAFGAVHLGPHFTFVAFELQLATNEVTLPVEELKDKQHKDREEFGNATAKRKADMDREGDKTGTISEFTENEAMSFASQVTSKAEE